MSGRLQGRCLSGGTPREATVLGVKGEVGHPMGCAARLVGVVQRVLCFSSALRIVSSLCIQAVRATFFVFPAASKRVYSARRTGLCRVPTRAAIYSAARTVLRPPQ